MHAHLRGSLWNPWDLHFHTPASFDYLDGSVTNQQIIDGLISKGVRLVAVTDHHRIDVPRIKDLQKLGGDNLTVLPGIEFRSELGGSQSVHFIGIFSEAADIADLWTKLAGKLEITEAEVAKRGDDKIYCPFVNTAKVIRELGGIVTVHAGTKSNSIEGLKNSDYIKQIVKKDLVKNCIDIYEIGAVTDAEPYRKIVFPQLDRPLPLVLCSDNHKISDYPAKSALWVRADPTFRGLLMVLREPTGRIFLGDRPPEQIRVEQNPTKYVRSISFQRGASAPASEKWFSGTVEFNHGLIAIIGNKGSGKSALADMLGLLGASKNAEFFPFLSRQRFRHPVVGFAQHFTATLKWESGDELSRTLLNPAGPEEVERLKYLPQDHVETVCTELAGAGKQGFEQELKAVIFSHVPDASRLGQVTLDDLVRFQTGEKQKRIDSLLKQLRELSRDRALLEVQADPGTKREIEEKIKRRELEIDAHDKTKPAEKHDPTKADGSPPPDPALLAELATAEAAKKQVTTAVTDATDKQRAAERRAAVAKRLLEKLGNFEKEFQVFVGSLNADVTELGLKTANLASLTINRTPAESIRDEAAAAVTAAKLLLDAANPDGLPKQLAGAQAKLAEVQAKLDAPNRAYQTYLKDLAEWQEKRNTLEGTEQEPESLKGLSTSLTALTALPARIAIAQTEQIKLAREILAEKLAQAEVYRTLFQPVQQFIDSHELAKNKLRLEFRAELTNEDFEDRLLGLLAQNRRGTFMGTDEGRAKAENWTETANWAAPESVVAFLDTIDHALHKDQREVSPQPVQLRDQLLRGKKVEEVFDLLYGLEYIQPRYILRWEGKDLAMLSPGERGTLLLVFYLLIDKGDMPLLIDQPEGNLDNQTVAKVLVDCIREARKRRQVFIVTHNPNLAVVCDADQVIYASMDKTAGNAVTYTTGALENPVISKHVTDVLEGTRWAFGVRSDKYEIGNDAT